MKKLDNYDLKLAAGLALRSDVKIAINEIIDRLNEYYELLDHQEEINECDSNYVRFIGAVLHLDVIFNFLFACKIFTGRTFREYTEALDDMNLKIMDKKGKVI